jgi:hypothetical protein
VLYTISVVNAGRGPGGSAPIVPGKSKATPDGPTMTNVVITDQLSPDFEAVAINAIGATVKQTGQTIEVSRDSLAPGQTLMVVVAVQIKSNTQLPAVFNQASLSYAGLSQALYSNAPEVKITGVRPAAVQTTAAGSVAAPGQPATPGNVGTVLPAGSTGAPLEGLVLLGATLMLHTFVSRRKRLALA